MRLTEPSLSAHPATAPFSPRGAFLCLTLGLLLASPSPLPAQPANLPAAIQADSAFWAEHHLAAGANPNTVLDRSPLLVHALRQGNFELARILLQRGASVSLARQNQPDLYALIPDTGDDGLALRFLVRAYGVIQELARPLPPGHTIAPERVIIFEPAIDYTHEGIAPSFYLNQAELRGQPGFDDDNNGFIDDIYGWSIASNQAYAATAIQLNVWENNRELTRQLVELHNRRMRGELTFNSPEFRKLNQSFLNPLAGLFGASGGYSDAKYLEHIVDLSHGSHVAGIVIHASEHRARIHAMSWETFGTERVGGLDIPSPEAHETYASYLARFHALNRDPLIAAGRRASDYLRTTRTSVVNGSVGYNFAGWLRRAEAVVSQLARHDPAVRDAARDHIRLLAYEFYAYYTLPSLIAIAENPQILFVAAAGNDNSDNDASLDSPAYLSRFFRHVITVAAHDAHQKPASFTNRGTRSVNLAAPGVEIESYGVAGTRILMQGTSMAAPAVAGVAARLRLDHPDATPEQLRLALLSGVTRHPDWQNLVSSGGLLNPTSTQALLQTTPSPEALIDALWNLTSSPPNQRPEEWAWIRNHLATANLAQPRHPELTYAHAVALDLTGNHREALASLNRVLALPSPSLRHWRSKLIILRNLEDHAEVLRTAETFDRLHTRTPFTGSADHLRDIYTWGILAATQLRDQPALARWNQRYTTVVGRPYDPAGDRPRTLTAQGTLQNGLPKLPDNSFYVEYSFRGELNAEVQIDLASSAFDTFLIVLGPDNYRQENDDGPGLGTHSRLNLKLPATGTYTIQANSFENNATGPFELRLHGRGISDLTRLTPEPAAPVINRLTGTLAPGTPQLTDGEYFRRHEIPLKRGDSVQIDLRSTAFDAYLILVGPGGFKLENDDGEGTGTDSRLRFEAPADGTYTITATSYGPRETGAYELLWQTTPGSARASRTLTSSPDELPTSVTTPRALKPLSK